MDRLTARRKLLRGSLSAPLVLTVASPSVLARTTFEACIARVDGQAGPAYLVGDDGFFRKAVPIYQCVLPTPDPSKAVGLSEAKGIVEPKKLGPSEPVINSLDANGQCLNVTFIEDGGAHYQLPGLQQIHIPPGYEIKETGNMAGQLVFFNSDGEMVGFGLSNSGNGTPITHSCWASFAG